jgi:hypothetical protein
LYGAARYVVILSIDRVEGKRLIGGIAQCKEAQLGAPFQTFSLEDMGPDPLNGEFELLCAA